MKPSGGSHRRAVSLKKLSVRSLFSKITKKLNSKDSLLLNVISFLLLLLYNFNYPLCRSSQMFTKALRIQRLANRAAEKELSVNHGGAHTLIGCVNDGL